MRRKDVIAATALMVALYCVAAALVRTYVFPHANIQGDFLSALAVVFTVGIAYAGYSLGRRHECQAVAETKRDVFLERPSLAHIRMLIEHNDVELQTVIMILNIADPYDPDTLPTKHWDLHRQFDEYLDFLEGVAILHNHGDVLKESIEGLWEYYFGRLADVDTLDHDSRTIKLQQIEECIASIYGGSPPASVENAWRNALTRYQSRERAPNPIPLDSLNPLQRPLWYYVKSQPYQFRPLATTVAGIIRKRK